MRWVQLSLGVCALCGCLAAAAQAGVTLADPVNVGTDGQYFEAGSTANVVLRIPISADAAGDTLQSITVINPYFADEPAAEPADIAAGTVRLWYMAVDPGSLNTTTAQMVGTLLFNSSRGFPAWDRSGLSRWVGNGSALYLTVDISTTPNTDVVCQLQVETSALVFASGPVAFSDPALPVSPPRLVITPYYAVTQLTANHTNTAQIVLSTGQSFSPMVLRMINPGTPLTAPVFLSGLTLTVRDAGGALLAPDRALSSLGLRDADTGMILSQVSSIPAGPGTVFLPLSTSVTAVDARRLEVFGTVCADTVTAAAAFRLEWGGAQDLAARDAYSGEPVAVSGFGDTFPMPSNLLSVQYAARALTVAHVAPLAANEVVIKGQSNVAPLNLIFRNPGNTGTARVDVTRLTLAVSDANGVTLAPAAVFSRLALASAGGAVIYGETTDLPTTGSLIILTLTNSFCSVPAYQSVTAYVLADIRPDATAISFRLSLPNATAVRAQDANSLLLVTVTNADASDPFPMYSNPVRVASSFLVQGRSLAPQTLYPGQQTDVLELRFTHPGPADLGALLLHGVTLTARDRSGQSLSLAVNVARIALVDTGANPMAQTVPADGSVYLPLGSVAIAPFSTLTLRVNVTLLSAPRDTSLSLGLTGRDAVSVSQPTDPTRPVFVAGAWPLFSAVASLGGGEGRLRLSNYPNPFHAGRAETRIAYYLEAPATVTATLYTLGGDQVRSLCRGSLQRVGEQVLVWDGRTGSGAVVVNGVYLLRVEAAMIGTSETITQIRKLAVVK